MKHFIFSILMISFMSSFSFAAETTTECPWMKEENSRNNPKANMAAKPKPKNVKGSSSAQ